MHRNGTATDKQPVIAGVAELTATHGLPLELILAAAEDERELRTLPVIRLRRRDQHGSTHIASRRSASSTYAFPHKFDGFLTRFAVSKQ